MPRTYRCRCMRSYKRAILTCYECTRDDACGTPGTGDILTCHVRTRADAWRTLESSSRTSDVHVPMHGVHWSHAHVPRTYTCRCRAPGTGGILTYQGRIRADIFHIHRVLEPSSRAMHVYVPMYFIYTGHWSHPHVPGTYLCQYMMKLRAPFNGGFHTYAHIHANL